VKGTELVTTKHTNSLRAMGRHLLWAVLLLPLAPLAVGCSHHAEGGEGEKKAEFPKVSVVNPTYKDLTREVFQPGYLRSYEQTPIYTKIAGFAEEPRVDINDYVKENDLLVMLYVPEVEEDLHVKAAEILQAKADLKQSKEAANAAKATVIAAVAQVAADAAGIVRAKADVTRWVAEDVRGQRLVKTSVFDQQTLDEIQAQRRASEALVEEVTAKWQSSQAKQQEAQAKYMKAEADVEVADAHLQVAMSKYNQWKAWLDYREVRAPYTGVVTQRNVHKGHFLQPASSGTTNRTAEPLFEMMRTDVMRLNVQVPEMDAAWIKPGDSPQVAFLKGVLGGSVVQAMVKKGDRAIVTFQGLPGFEVTGTVTRFSYSLDEHARTLRVEIHLANPTGKLKPGMYANVTILAKIQNAITLPSEAILQDIMNGKDRPYCFVVEDGKVKKLFVQIGARCNEGVQLLRKQWPGSGKWETFTGKEVVVSTNAAALQDGQVVEVKGSEEKETKEEK
jgi:HlyD family secretion protein